MLGLLGLDPAHSLHLWINTEWVSAGKVSKDTVLNRKLVTWESFCRPSRDFDVTRQETLQTERFLVRELFVNQIFLPVVEDHLLAEHKVEWSTVGKETGSSKTISDKLSLVDFVVFILLCPSLLLGTKTGDELRGGVQLPSHLSLTL